MRHSRYASNGRTVPGAYLSAGCQEHLPRGLCVFGFVYALDIMIGLFRDTQVGRPRIIELLGPVAMLSIPVAILAGLVWICAIISARRTEDF